MVLWLHTFKLPKPKLLQFSIYLILSGCGGVERSGLGIERILLERLQDERAREAITNVEERAQYGKLWMADRWRRIHLRKKNGYRIQDECSQLRSSKEQDMES